MPARRKSRSSPRRSKSPRSRSSKVLKRRSSGVRRTKRRLSSCARRYRASEGKRKSAINALRNALRKHINLSGENYDAAITDLVNRPDKISIHKVDKLLEELEPLELTESHKFEIAFLYLPLKSRAKAKERIRAALRNKSTSITPISASNVHKFLLLASLQFFKTLGLELSTLTPEQAAMSRNELQNLGASRNQCLGRLREAGIQLEPVESRLLGSHTKVDRFINSLDTDGTVNKTTVDRILDVLRICLFHNEILQVATLHLEKNERESVRELWMREHNDDTMLDTPQLITTDVIDAFIAGQKSALQ